MGTNYVIKYRFFMKSQEFKFNSFLFNCFLFNLIKTVCYELPQRPCVDPVATLWAGRPCAILYLGFPYVVRDLVRLQ